LITTQLTTLSDRLYAQTLDTVLVSKKRQITSARYSILAPIIFTVNIMNGTRSAENVSETIRNIDTRTSRSEIIGFNETIGFNPVGMLHVHTHNYIYTYVHMCKLNYVSKYS